MLLSDVCLSVVSLSLSVAYIVPKLRTERPRKTGGTGVSGLTRGLATLPQGGSRSLWWSEIRMENPQEDPLAVHCFCVCSGSALLEDLLGVSRSRERDLLPILPIYSLCIVAFYSAIC